MPPSTDTARREAYYRTAMALLRFVEARAPTARRFGPEADALWRSFAGSRDSLDLDIGDRLELLLRDADRQWGGAFGPRAVFALRSAHEQDAFGADWRRLSPREAEPLWNQPATSEADPVQTILQIWALEPKPFALPKLGPSSRWIVAGLSAIVATLRAFLANPDLSWPNQVVVIADEPGPRQLAAAAAALADHAEATLLLTTEQLTPDQNKRVHARLGATLEQVISPDASPKHHAAAKRLAVRAK